MLHITRRCEYAIRALLELATRPASDPATIRDIAGEQRVPRKFLAVILAQLRHAGLVESLRGPRGGYVLARPAERITVGQVLCLVDGPLEPEGHVSVRRDVRRGENALAEIRQRVRQAVESVLESTTVADLAESQERRRAARVANYCI